MNEWIAIAAELFVAVAFGAMIFFAAVMAPLIFTKLEEETAGRFIREVFPRYYAFLAILCGIAAPCLASTAPVVASTICTKSSSMQSSEGAPRRSRQTSSTSPLAGAKRRRPRTP